MKNTIFSKLKSVSEIVETMIRGLETQWMPVDMYDFSVIKEKTYFKIFKKKVCYGCAATNALCELNQKPFNYKTTIDEGTRAIASDLDDDVIFAFEMAIENLRLGELDLFIYHLKKIDYVFNFEIKKCSSYSLNKDGNAVYLPQLGTEDYKKKLPDYKIYAKNLKEIGL
ncbi:hypothetical protein [Clostridium sp.]|jgi:hypothetical protein|uniref:hypothetical protein n=1 Tax=Clostridium sp. TaxID=1506 RepID=UPI003EE87D6B